MIAYDKYNPGMPGAFDRKPLHYSTAANRPSFAPVCMLCLLLCLVISPAKAGASSASPDANSPSSPEQVQPADTANDSNEPATTLQDSGPVPMGPPKPTIEIDATAPSAPQAPARPHKDDWLIAKNPTTDLTRKIWQDRTSVPKGDKDNKTKEQLRQLIDRIRAIKFKPKKKVYEPVVIVEPIVPPEPNITTVEPSDRNQTGPPQEQTIHKKPQPGALSDETMEIITEKLKQPELLDNPFELGEILFNAGRLNQAALCYSQALTQIDPNQPDPTEKRPWILFQIGGCLRKDDPTKALEAYSQLISEHAGSLWTDLAKTHVNIITWYQQDKPRILIEESRPKSTEDTIPAEFVLTTESQANTEQ